MEKNEDLVVDRLYPGVCSEMTNWVAHPPTLEKQIGHP